MEVVQLSNLGNAVAGDFQNGYAPPLACAGSDTFTVGSNPGSGPPCATPATANRFWDFHSTNRTVSVLRQTAAANRTVICRQWYYCYNNQLPANGTFLITRTYNAAMWTPPGAAAVEVTQITVAKAAE
jgi:hypothetical protein